jgi:UDP-glucuronate decarboxylase
MLDLAQQIIDLTYSKIKMIFLPLPQDDPMQRRPVIDLAKKELDWEPTVNLREGLTKTIEYFESVI